MNNKKPFAVQVPIEEFERIEEVIENYGLSNQKPHKNDRLPVTNNSPLSELQFWVNSRLYTHPAA